MSRARGRRDGAGGLAIRRAAQARGRLAETIAAVWLRLKFYRVLARGFRLPVGEIDLIARRGDLVVFVEVKRRADLAAGLDAISPRQRLRLVRAAEGYLARHPELARCRLRFDVIVVRPGALPRHVPGAFRADGG